MPRVQGHRQLLAGTITFAIVSLLGLFVGGISLIPTLAASSVDQQYERSGTCTGGRTSDCYSSQTGILIDVQVNNTGPNGGCHVVVSSNLGTRTEYMAYRSDCDGFSTGQKVRIKVWQSQITAVGPLSSSSLGRTSDNPVWIYENDRLGVIAGFLIGIAGMVAALVFWWRYRRAGRLAQLAFDRRVVPPG